MMNIYNAINHQGPHPKINLIANANMASFYVNNYMYIALGDGPDTYGTAQL